MTARTPQRQHLIDLLGPVITSQGYDLDDLSVTAAGRRSLIRITVDGEDGIDLDAVAAVSRAVADTLDTDGESEFAGPYVLEVSSPGVERPLRSARDFERHVGEKVRVRTSTLVEGARSHTGALVAADGEAITVATEVGAHRIPLAEVASARTVFEWGTPAGPAPRKGERKK